MNSCMKKVCECKINKLTKIVQDYAFAQVDLMSLKLFFSFMLGQKLLKLFSPEI